MRFIFIVGLLAIPFYFSFFFVLALGLQYTPLTYHTVPLNKSYTSCIMLEACSSMSFPLPFLCAIFCHTFYFYIYLKICSIFLFCFKQLSFKEIKMLKIKCILYLSSYLPFLAFFNPSYRLTFL